MSRSISLLSSLLFVLLLFTPTILADSEREFQELARDVPEDRLHAALHDYNGFKFKHGVFPGDRPALDAIHRERAADATRLVKLAKRQSNTTTTSSRNTATSATSARPTTTNTPTTIVSTSPSSTGQSTQSTQSTRQTTSESGSTSAAPSVTAKRGTTSSTSRITRTVTGPDGSLSTETSLTVVVATPTETDSSPSSGGTASSTDKSTPGLQQNAGLRVSGGDSVIVAVIAALGFFML